MSNNTKMPNPCTTCGQKKIPIKIRAGKYAGIIATVTILTQIICSLGIEVIP